MVDLSIKGKDGGGARKAPPPLRPPPDPRARVASFPLPASSILNAKPLPRLLVDEAYLKARKIAGSPPDYLHFETVLRDLEPDKNEVIDLSYSPLARKWAEKLVEDVIMSESGLTKVKAMLDFGNSMRIMEDGTLVVRFGIRGDRISLPPKAVVADILRALKLRGF